MYALLLLAVLFPSHPVPAETHALIVGVGTYASGIPTEIRADVDAREMARALERANIHNITTLVNEDATQNDILNWFDVAELNVHPGDTVFLYFAGHGGMVSDITGREEESAAFFPYDADGSGPASIDHAITDEELGNLVIRRLRDCVVVVFIDACHSGGLMREGTDSSLVSRGEGVSRGVLTAVRERDDEGRTLFLSSSREFEQSWEYPGQTPAGIFTSFLVEAMTCADVDLDGVITFGELAAYVSEGVESFVIEQEGTYQRPVSGAAPEDPESDAIPLFEATDECTRLARIDADAAVATGTSDESVEILDPALEEAIRARLHGYAGTLTKELAESITTLEAPSSEIRSLGGLEAFSNLEWIDLRNNQIEDLTPLTEMKLRTAKLGYNELVSLDALAGSEDMTYLAAEGNLLDDISALSEMQGLTWLLLGDNEISDLDPLADKTALVRLELPRNDISAIAALSELTSLERLDLASNRIASVEPLSELGNLRRLDLGGNRVVDIRPLSRLANVEVLELSLNLIVDVAPLAELVHLTALGLGGNRIVDVDSLANLVELQGLGLGWNRIEDITALSDLNDLLWLDLSNNGISDIAALAELVNLRSLLLSGNPLGDISPLQRMISMVGLDADDAEIRDISPLESMTDLEWLSLAGNHISDIGVVAGMTELTCLYLEDNEITDMSPVLQLSKLEDLDLSGNPLCERISGTATLDPPNSEPLYPGVTYDLRVHVDLAVAGAPIYETISLVDGRDCWTTDCLTLAFSGVLEPGRHAFDVTTEYTVPCNAEPGWIVWYSFGIEFVPHNGWAVGSLSPLVPRFGYSPAVPTVQTVVRFQDETAASGNILSREWAVDGVKLGEGDTFTYAFPSVGTYDVTLSIRRACDDQPAKVTQSIVVGP